MGCNVRVVVVSVVVGAFLCGCSNSQSQSSATSAPATATPAASTSPVAAAPVATTSPAVVAAPTGTTAASAAPTVAVTFTDINGIFAQQAITDEATLGILDATSGAFKPNAPIARADFVRWLVKADNAYFQSSPQSQIREAEDTTSTFVDVAPSNPNFGYIQGLANAGFVIGKNATHFAPDKPLIREELISIKTQLDERNAIPPTPGDLQFMGYSDKSTIDPQFVGAVYEDSTARSTGNIARVWGSLKVLHPRQPVTRADAALAIDVIGSGGYASTPNGSAAVTLGRSPPP